MTEQWQIFKPILETNDDAYDQKLN